MTKEEAIWWVNHLFEIRKEEYFNKGMMEDAKEVEEAQHMAIESLKNEPILCEDCKHRNTWDNLRFDPQYYRCGRGIKFRDYGYVREDDYCPLGERREE